MLAGILRAEADKPAQPKPAQSESRERINRTLAGTLFERRSEGEKTPKPKVEVGESDAKSAPKAEAVVTAERRDRTDAETGGEFNPAEWSAQTYELPLDARNEGEFIDLRHPLNTRERGGNEARPTDRRSVRRPGAEAGLAPLAAEALLGRSGDGKEGEPPDAAEPPENFENAAAENAAAGGGAEEPPDDLFESVPGAGGDGGSGEPPEPPETLFPFAHEPPEPPRSPGQSATYGGHPEPAAVFRHYAEQDALAHQAVDAPPGGIMPNGERLLTEREAEEQAMYAQRRGVGSGVASGLVLGWWLRGRRAKRREKRAAKKHKAEVRKLEKAQESQRWVAEAQGEKQAETERKLQYMERRRQETQTEYRAAEAAASAEQLARKQLEAQRTPEINLSRVAEQPAEQIEVPDGDRLKRSEWLTTQVDVRTGRPVEQPSFHYGREYYRERAAENMPIAHRNAAAGEVALVAASIDNGRPAGKSDDAAGGATSPQAQPQGAQSTAHIPDATSSGPPPQIPRTRSGDRQSDSSVWLYVAALLVIAVLLYVVLR